MNTECVEYKIVIRIAKPDDLPDIFQMVDMYDGNMRHDKKIAKNFIRDILYVQGVLLGYYNDELIGGVAGYSLPSMFSDDLNFCVMFFFMKPHYRRFTKYFIKELELSLLGTRVTKIVFGFPAPGMDEQSEKARRFIKIMGYKEMETHYYKSFVN